MALSAHYQILTAEANVVVSKALAEAQADLVIITNADAVAAMGRTMNGDDIKTAVHAVFVAAPEQCPCHNIICAAAIQQKLRAASTARCGEVC